MKEVANIRWLRSALLILVVLFLMTLPIGALPNPPGPREIRQKDVPVRITEPGSYVLTSTLRITDPDVTAIYVESDDVTIDLNGFTIIGPEIGDVGTGYGINTDVRNNVVVRNGGVRGFFAPAGACIHLPGSNNRIENVRVQSCPAEAIFVGPSGAVVDCQIAYSGSGVNTDGATLVLNNTFLDSGGYCIMTYGGSPNAYGGVVVMGNTCKSSSGEGTGIIVLGPGNRIEGNVVTGTYNGIDLSQSTGSFFAGNLVQGIVDTAVVGAGDDWDGGNYIIP